MAHLRRVALAAQVWLTAVMTLVAGVPAKVVRELTLQEMAWKVEGTRSYQELTRRSLSTMQVTVPLAEEEPGRKRIEMPDLLPLSLTRRS